MAIGAPAVPLALIAHIRFLKAIEALGLIRDPRAIDPLLSTARNYYNEEKIIALTQQALINIGPAVIPRIANDLQNPPWQVRLMFCRVLSQLKSQSPEALAPLATLANDSSVYVERAALEALVGVSDVDVARALVKSLNNQDLSKQAAELLVAMKSTALAPLIYGLDGKADNQRQWSAWALGKMKDPDAIEPLIKRLVTETQSAAVDEVEQNLAEALDKLSRRLGPSNHSRTSGLSRGEKNGCGLESACGHRSSGSTGADRAHTVI